MGSGVYKLIVMAEFSEGKMLVKMLSAWPHFSCTESPSVVETFMVFFFKSSLRVSSTLRHLGILDLVLNETLKFTNHWGQIYISKLVKLDTIDKRGILLTGIAKAAPRRQANKIQVPIS